MYTNKKATFVYNQKSFFFIQINIVLVVVCMCFDVAFYVVVLQHPQYIAG